ncbi:DUF1993 family protein [Sphingopyxis sp. H115]|uniref:DUF1993 domain-containing protein n=1 Tax=Sphingopyxis sp. H115 TaxID=1759073 RepID=UPI0007367A78|nr:DUF1993 domain-containing protein [Sphingopyxis sp. H115]KTE08242.1 hypothetical protein ATE71_14240 [Sphingopyxis sp. H115]
MLYDLTVPAWQNGLKALSSELARARTWGEENAVGELQFAVARLAPDMFPLASQVRFSCAQTLQPLARLAGIDIPDFAEDAPGFGGMQEQIAAALAILETVDRDAMGSDPDHMVSFTLPNGMTFDMRAFDYVRDWAQPQFFFHRTTAYAIMRHMGVPLGKADYVGYMMRYLRAGTAPAA